MENVHGIRSQKPLRLTCWTLFLGILQTRIGPHWKKKLSKVLVLYTVGKLIEN